jgi:hypothetical protein
LFVTVIAYHGKADAHPLGFNGIPENLVIEIKKSKSLPSSYSTLRNEGNALIIDWRTDNGLEDEGIPRVISPSRKFGKTDEVMIKDNSATNYVAYFNVNTSPDTMGWQTDVAATIPYEHRRGTYEHEVTHAFGGGHNPFCLDSILSTLASCQNADGSFSRRLTPGPHDTSDAINDGMSDYTAIGSHPLAGEGVPQDVNPTTAEVDTGDDVSLYDSSGEPKTIEDLYGGPNVSDKEMLQEAEAAGVVFEYVGKE